MKRERRETVNKLRRDLRRARPSLRVLAPLNYWVLSAIAYFNLIFGTVFYLNTEERINTPLEAVNSVLTYDFWGIVMVLLGAVSLFSLYTNRWELIRKTIVAGVVIKTAWSIAILMRSVAFPDTILAGLSWALVALIHIGCYVFFAPKIPGDEEV